MKKFAWFSFILVIGLGIMVLSGHSSIAQDRAVKGTGINKAALSDSELDLVAGGTVGPEGLCFGPPCTGAIVIGAPTGKVTNGNTGQNNPACTAGCDGANGTQGSPNGGNGTDGKNGKTPTVGNPFFTPPPNPSSTKTPNGGNGGAGGSGFSANKTVISCNVNGLPC